MAGDFRSRIHPGFAFVVLLAAAAIGERLFPVDGLRGDDSIRIACAAALLVGGCAIWLVAFTTMRRAGTAIEPGEPVSSLVASGPFRFSRNPLYVGLLLASLAFAFLTNSIWFLGATIALWLLLQLFVVPGEERLLEGQFGDAYRTYRSSVRRWL